MITRITGETDLDFHKRIIYGKLIDKTLMDEDYADLAELAYGETSSSDHARKMMYGSRKTLELMDKFLGDNIDDSKILSEVELAKTELKKEKIKLSRQRVELNRTLNKQAQREEIHEIFEAALKSEKDWSFNPPILEGNDDIELAISLTDMHVGADIDNEFNIFNSDVLKIMLEDYISQIRIIQKTHGAKKCVVWANGDLVNGKIHGLAVSNRENIVQQIQVATELISNFLIELGEMFEQVRFCLSPGNHSRLCERKDEEILGERLDLLIEWAVEKELCKHKCLNVIFNDYRKVDTTMYAVKISGRDYIGTHGDFDSENKISELIKFCENAYDERVKFTAILTGHLHHNFVKNIRGTTLVQAGGFLGIDSYCLSKRIYGEAEQMVLVCSSNGIDCFYPIRFKNNEKKRKML